MNIKVKLKHGRSEAEFCFSESSAFLSYNEPIYDINHDDFMERLDSFLPIESKMYENITIVVSDKTRMCGYTEYLPWIIEGLKSRYMTCDITFYVAYGTHPRQTDEESRNTYGWVYDKYKFVHHDCNDISIFDLIGTTKRGTPITIRKDILASSLIITMGAISHHYFAGYGGGRKLLFPGLAERNAIYHNHSLFLDHNKHTLSNGCQIGRIIGNPLAEDLEEIESYIPNRISIHGILDTTGKVCRFIFNDFLESCKIQDECYKKDEELFDLVVASSGGYPKDINFIQSHKSIHNASAFVKDGGKLVILSECIDGIGSSNFMKYMGNGFDSAFSILEKNYEGNGGTALSMMQKTSRIKIYMFTSLNEEECKLLCVNKVQEEEISSLILEEKGKIAIIKNASMLVR